MDGKQLARQVNVRIRDVAEAFAYVTGDDVDEIAFICECGCLRAAPETLAAYNGLHGQPLIVTGHPVPARPMAPS